MTRERPLLLVVQPWRRDAPALIERLTRLKLEVVTVADTESADNVMRRRTVRCLVSELRAPRIDGLALLRRGLARNPALCAVLIARREDSEAAAAALRSGAYDVLARPVPVGRLLAVLTRGLEHQALAARAAEMAGQLDDHLGHEGLTGSSRAIHRVMEQARTVAPTRASVLIEGEPGTGRRLLAQLIHRESPRRDEPFVSVDCAVSGAGVLEGVLFGYERGDLGGDVVRPGRLEQADGGTLFLDEVGEAPPRVQARLLRAIQDRAFERAGGTHTLHADVRFLASTSRDLERETGAAPFRADLFQRLAAVRIAMPPLRERSEDLPLLVDGFVREANRRHGRKVEGVTPGALEALLRHGWPGNAHELKTVIEGMVLAVAERRRLDLSDLPRSLRGRVGRDAALEVSVGMTVREAERRLVEATLHHTGGDKPRAAAMLGIGLRTLYRKIEEYGLRF